MTESAPPAKRSVGLLVSVAAVTLVLDQLTKWWAVEALSDGPVELVFDWRFNLVRNPAAAFSLGEGLGPLLGVLALGVVAMVLVMSREYTATLPTIAVGMIVGGALGNIADRVFRSESGFLGGEVIDFVDLRRWPVFNLADAAVVIGVILLGGYTVFVDWRRPEPDSDAADAEPADPESSPGPPDDDAEAGGDGPAADLSGG